MHKPLSSRRIVFLTGLVVLFALEQAVCPAAEPAHARPNAPNVEDLLTWLPVDTETVFVVQEPFTIADPAKPAPKKPESVILIESLFYGPFNASEKSAALFRGLVGQKVLRIVEGSRQFESPGDFGMMHYRGCQITVFDGDADRAWNALKKAVTSQPHETARIAASDVLIIPKEPNKAWTIFFARPKPDVLLAATDRDYLAEVLARIGRKSANRALPKELPEWKHVDTTAPMWAVRHFDRKRGPTDFTSPLAAFPEGDSRSDACAVGVTFALCKSEKQYVGTVSYLSEAKDMGVACRDWIYPRRDPQMKFRLVQKGVVEIKSPLASGDLGIQFAIKVYRILGHGLII